MIAVGLAEARNSMSRKSHRLEDLGIARVGIGDRVARDRRLVRGAGQPPRQQLGRDRQHRKDECAAR